VLSAGGMFGAYQAGVWKALAPVWQPDMVVGASAGALNGWAIAGGCSPAELAAIWLDARMEELMRPRWRLPVFDAAALSERAQALFTRYQPRVPYALTLCQIPRLRPRLVRGEEVTWRHLLASCAVPCGFAPVRIDGKLYADGGVLGALPLWAAQEMGADRAVAVNALVIMPSRTIRMAARLGCWIGSPKIASSDFEVLRIEREGPLGALRDAVRWSKANAQRWIEMGEEDGARAAHELAGLTTRGGIPLK
jgi:NTE family protein